MTTTIKAIYEIPPEPIDVKFGDTIRLPDGTLIIFEEGKGNVLSISEIPPSCQCEIVTIHKGSDK